MSEPSCAGPLARHVEKGDRRLLSLRMDDSPAAVRLWDFLLTEDERLHEARRAGKFIVGAMKDLGTVPVIAFSFDDVVAFYPDGAWWTPCIMHGTTRLLEIADSLGIDDSFCPVRALLGAFVTREHFPIPDLLVCSAGATCDDFSAVAQRLEDLGHEILWWEMPYRRPPEPEEEAVPLPGGLFAPRGLVEVVALELARVRDAIAVKARQELDDGRLARGIARANQVRRRLDALRVLAYRAEPCPLPALEMQIAEMLAIHFCSDREETIRVLDDLLAEARRRVRAGRGVGRPDAARVYWVNPVADLRAMNLLEEAGGRICGTDYLFGHALVRIPEDLPPIEALARVALADPMVGSAVDRAELVCRDVERFGAEAVVVSRIPGASHCALEGDVIREVVDGRLGLPVLEIEVPSICDPIEPALRTRLEALVETVVARRRGA
jgi:benzoyl-CoA reductase/2-hydroxyglutaryl-CoA dehydratase subunit BcrC/BadD/HgdB